MSAAFKCRVKHDPSLIPTMTWLKDSGELPDDERYKDLEHQDYEINLIHVNTVKKKHKKNPKEKRIILLWHSVVRFVVGSDSLTIKDVTEEDKGRYTCIMNTTLDQDSASAVLTVVGTFTVEHTLKVFFPIQAGCQRTGLWTEIRQCRFWIHLVFLKKSKL